jgi:hypothetical protein
VINQVLVAMVLLQRSKPTGWFQRSSGFRLMPTRRLD